MRRSFQIGKNLSVEIEPDGGSLILETGEWYDWPESDAVFISLDARDRLVAVLRQAVPLPAFHWDTNDLS